MQFHGMTVECLSVYLALHTACRSLHHCIVNYSATFYFPPTSLLHCVCSSTLSTTTSSNKFSGDTVEYFSVYLATRTACRPLHPCIAHCAYCRWRKVMGITLEPHCSEGLPGLEPEGRTVLTPAPAGLTLRNLLG